MYVLYTIFAYFVHAKQVKKKALTWSVPPLEEREASLLFFYFFFKYCIVKRGIIKEFDFEMGQS